MYSMFWTNLVLFLTNLPKSTYCVCIPTYMKSGLVKIGEAHRILGVSLNTLRRWEQAGKITPIRTPGGTRLYSLELLKTFAETGIQISSDTDFKSGLSKRTLERYKQNISKDISSTSTQDLLKSIHSSVTASESAAVPEIASSSLTPRNDIILKNPFFKNKFFLGSGAFLTLALVAVSGVIGSYLFYKSEPPSAPNYQQHTSPPGLQTNNSNVLAALASPQFLEVNTDTQINGLLAVRDSVNNIIMEGTPSASTFELASGDTTLTITNDATLDQDVSTTSTPSFTTLNLSATTNQIIFQSGGPTGTLTWTPTGSAKVVTIPDKTGEVSLLGQTISNSELDSSSITVTAGTNLTGGGSVSLGGSITLTLKDSISLSGTLAVTGATTLASTTASTLIVSGTTTFNGVAYTWPSADGTSGYTLATNGSGTLSWNTLSSAGGWTDDGTLVRLTTSTDQVGIGTATPNASYQLETTGNVGIGGSLTVSSASTLNSLQVTKSISGATLGISGASSLQALSATDITSTTLTTTGNVGVGGSITGFGALSGLNVTGLTSLAGLNATTINATSLATSGNITNAGIFLASDGTASAPAYSLSTDPDTGLWRNTTNMLSLTTGGTPSSGSTINGLSINSTGNVGIGTTNPESKLTVVGTTSDSSANALRVYNSAGNSLLEVQNDGQVTVGYVNGSTASVGLVVSGPAGSSPTTQRLSLNQLGGTVISVQHSSFNPVLTAELTGINLNLNTALTGGNLTTVAQNTTGISLAMPATTGGASTTSRAITVSSGAFTNSSGTSTWTGLDLNMPIITQSGGTLTSYGIKITGGTVNSGTSYAFISDSNAGNVGIGVSLPNKTLSILGTVGIGYTGANQLLSVGTVLGINGNVGIGTTTADYNLSVVGTTNITGNVGIGSSLTVSSASTLDSLAVTKSISGATLGISGTANLSGNLGIGGTATFSSAIRNLGYGAGVLQSDSSGYITSGALSLSSSSISGILPIANGGTNASSFVTGGVIYFDGTRLTQQANQLFVSTSGNVGVGNSNPLALFQAGPNASNGLFVTSLGNVGIGTSSPAFNFHLVGTGTGTGIQLLTQNSTQTNFGLSVLDNGNVGIGTTGPTSLFSVAGAAAIGSGYAVGSSTTPTNGLIVQGNVGIGTSTPGGRLDIDTTQTSGDVLNISVPSSTTLAGAMNGLNIDLSTNLTASSYDLTGLNLSLATADNIRGITIGSLTGVSSARGIDIGAIGASASPNTGDGADGAATASGTSSDNINTESLVGRSCSNDATTYDDTAGDAPIYISTANTSAGATTMTLTQAPASTCLAAGDEVLIINLMGTSGANSDVGEYEARTLSSVSSTTLTFASALTNGYDGTTQKIMVQRVPNYTSVTVNTGVTLTANDFDGTAGGIIFFRATGTVTLSGTGIISTDGLGYDGGSASGSATGTGGQSYEGNGTSTGGSNGNGVATGGGTSPGTAGTRGGGGGGGLSSCTICGGGGGAGGGYGGGGGGGGGGDQDAGIVAGGSGGDTGVGAGGGGGAASGSSAGSGGAGGNAGSAGANGTGTSPGTGGAAGSDTTTGQGGGASANTNIRGGGAGGGGLYGSSNLTTAGKIFLGSGGGGGGAANIATGFAGGAGGGIVIINANAVSIEASASIRSNGSVGTAVVGFPGAGGGGAGGSILISSSNSFALGSNLVTATGGTGGSGVAGGGGGGGNGGVGRINVGNASDPTGSNPDASSISTSASNIYGIALSTLTGGLTSNYQITTGAITAIASATNAQLNLGGISGTAASSTNYGLNIGAISATGTNNYGLFVGNVSGATNNYAAIFNGGNVGIGTSSPGARLAVAGGTIIGYTGAQTAPTNGLAVFGNVGIGTTSPIQALHVVGQCVAKGTRIRRRRRRSSLRGGEDDEAILPERDRHALRARDDDYVEEDVPVEQIQPGDEILSLNEKTGQFEWHTVENTMDMGIQEVFRLETERGKWIETTANHPYLVLEELTNKLIGNNHQDNQNQNQGKSNANFEIPIDNFIISGHKFSSHIKHYTNFLNANAIPNAAIPSNKLNIDGTNLNVAFFATSGMITTAPNQPADRLTSKSDSVNQNFASIFDSIAQSKWTKVSALKIGQYIATADGWERIVNIENAGRKQTYDLQIANTHNFLANDIVAHNTYINSGLNIGTAFTGGAAVPSNGLAVSGNVGIGTTTANSSLSISGNAHIGSLYQSIVAPTNGLFVDGNVGIGATTSSNLLDVWGNARIAGTLTVDQGTTFGGNLTLSGNLLPGANDIYDLGSDTLRWKDLYLGPGTLHLGTSTSDEYSLSFDTTNNRLGFNLNDSGPAEVVFDSNGNVGIGTTGPTAKLEVIGTTSIAGIQTGSATSTLTLEGASTDSSGLIISQNNITDTSSITNFYNGPLTFGTNNLERMRILSGGNVGIGTTAPDHKLEVSGGDIKVSGTNNPSISFNSNSTQSNSRNWKWETNNVAWGSLELFRTTANGEDTEPATSVMAFDLNGNVGIGTSLPTGRLAFSGAESNIPSIKFQTSTSTTLADAAISTNDDSGGTQLLIGSNIYYNSSAAITQFDTTRSGSGISFGYTGAMQFFTNSGSTLPTEQMRLNSGGNLGIGTAAPIADLHLLGDASLTAVNLLTQAADGTFGLAVLDNGNVGIGTTGPGAKLEVNGGAILNGNLTWTTDTNNNIGAASSGRPNNIYLGNTLFAAGAVYVGTQTAISGAAAVIDGGNLIVKTGGNVGIGTVSPIAKLNLFGAAAGTGVNLLTQSSTGAFGLAVLDNGNVGIGTTGPGYALDISSGTFRTQGGNIYIQDSVPTFTTIINQTSSLSQFYNNAAKDMSFATNATVGAGYPTLYLKAGSTNASGNVGIGTTAPALTLHLDGATQAVPASGGTSQSAGGRIRLSSVSSSAIFDMGTAGGNGAWLQSTDRLNLALTYPLLLNPNGGNVGIGTTGPARLFHVAGATNTLTARIDIAGYADSNVGTLELRDTTAFATGVGGRINFAGANDTGAFSQFASIQGIKENSTQGNSAGALVFNTIPHAGSLTERMRITAAGNVGIGTTGPVAKLEVVTTSDTTGAPSNWTGQNFTVGTGGANGGSVGISYDQTNNKGYINSLSPGVAWRDLIFNAGGGGNIGIGGFSGATVPGYKLDVVGNGHFSTSLTADTTITSGTTITQGSFTTANSERLCWDASGASEITDCTGTPGDYAELYGSEDPSIEAGEIVISAPAPATASAGLTENKVYMAKSTKSYQNNILGIISTKPNDVIGEVFTIKDPKTGNDLIDPITGKKIYTDNARPVALIGRVPVKVSLENGPIQPGDYLTSSSTPGVAMKASRPGPTVGKALEEFDGGDCFVADAPRNDEEGATPSDVIASEAKQSCQDKILVFVNVSYADPGNFFANLSFDSEGNLIIPRIKVGSIILDSSIASASSSLRAEGVAISLVSDPNYTSPGPSTTTSSNTFYDLGGKIASIEERVAALEKIASSQTPQSDVAGEATTSGVIASDSEAISNQEIATESATPRDDVALNLTPPDILLATGSAQLASLTVSEATVSGMLAGYDLNISNSLKSLGETILGNTIVAGDLTVDGTLSLSGNSINAVSTLYLQSSTLAEGLDIFNGKVTIDNEGNIQTSGEVAAASITTNKLTISTQIASSSGTPRNDNASIGSDSIPANETKTTIISSDISDSSKVFITPITTTDKVLSVTNIKTNESFDVEVLTPSPVDIKFNWWIVQTE